MVRSMTATDHLLADDAPALLESDAWACSKR